MTSKQRQCQSLASNARAPEDPEANFADFVDYLRKLDLMHGHDDPELPSKPKSSKGNTEKQAFNALNRALQSNPKP